MVKKLKKAKERKKKKKLFQQGTKERQKDLGSALLVYNLWSICLQGVH